jgi:hypothetical protein
VFLLEAVARAEHASMAQPPERYQTKKIVVVIDFLQLLNDRFGANSAIRKEFFSLLAYFDNGSRGGPISKFMCADL